MSSNKRGNIFGQGKPERPYEERDDPAEVPQRATAAQLAARKIRTAKVRRPAGASGLSQSANFGAPQQNDFGFGASAPAPSDNSANNFAFGGNNDSSNTAFGGGGATNSFPPAQSVAPSNTFTNSSFPAFGGASSQGAGFNPKPPSSTGFNFTSGGANPFATQMPAPTTNGNAAPPAFGGGATSMFNNAAQPKSNPFGGFGQDNTSAAPSGGMFGNSSSAASGGMFGTASAAPSGGMFGTASAAPSGSMFGTSGAAPSGGMFGATSGASNATSTPAFTFGAASTSTKPATSAPEKNNLFNSFGANAQKPEAPKETAAPNMFSGFGTNAQKSETPQEQATPHNNNIFGGFGTSAQATPNTTAPAASNSFNFGATAAAPSTNLFGTAMPSASTPTPSNPFANLPATPSTSSTPFSGFGANSQTPQTQEKAPVTSNNLFSSLKKPVEASSTTVAQTPKSNPFAGLAKPVESSTAAETPKSNPFVGLANPANTPAATQAAGAPGFSIFGTVQNKDAAASGSTRKGVATLKAPDASKSSLFQPFSTPQPAKTVDVETPQAGLFSAAPKTSSGMFSQPFQPEANNSSNFSKPQSSSMERPQEPELPNVPKVHVPKEWAVPGAANARNGDGLFKQISDLTAQLQILNEKYRQQLSILPVTADWSSVSLWHCQHATDIKKKIDNAKKQRAAAKGITGNESTLSTKRKVSDDGPESRDLSPSKRARPAPHESAKVSSLPQQAPQPPAPAPKFNPPATTTSNMFAKAIGNKPSTPSTSTNLFAPKSTQKLSTEPSKPAAPDTSYGFTPSAPATNGTSVSSGFKPSTVFTGGGGGFMAQFSKTAKTYKELAAERKKKAKDEDYDSDDETEEQWSDRYDKAEATRLAEEKKVAATTTFNISGAKASSQTQPGAAKPDANPSGSTSPISNPFAGLLNPKSGTSTPGLFTPRAASPALSTGSQSVFNAPSASQTPSSNIFGHLYSGPSSNHHDESDEDDGEQQEPVGSLESTTPPKRKFGESETESETDRHKQDTGSKGSLLSRISRDNESESEQENNSNYASNFGQSNGTTTPSGKPFQFFDFGAASKSTTSKPDTFAGDQTFKVGTPIKFGGATTTEKDAPPKFQFQPATPSPADFSTTPVKQPPFSLFNFGSSTGGSSLLAPNAGLSGASSVHSSVFSSRAGTPLSEADTSAASAAGDDEEGGKHEQVDFSQLTEEETDAYDIVFHTEIVLAKQQVDKDGTKEWANLAKGPLWILKDKETARCSVRVRIASGATPLNYQILPSLPASVTGSSRKMVMATKPAKEGGLQSILYAVKSPEIADEMAAKYNDSRPSV